MSGASKDKMVSAYHRVVQYGSVTGVTLPVDGVQCLKIIVKNPGRFRKRGRPEEAAAKSRNTGEGGRGNRPMSLSGIISSVSII